MLGSLEMTAARTVIAEVDRHIVVLWMVDAQMAFAALAGRNLLIVRLVCPESGCFVLDARVLQ